jgi:hypothetical protein
MADCPSTGYSVTKTAGKFLNGAVLTIIGIVLASAMTVLLGFQAPDGGILQNLLYKFAIAAAVGLIAAAQNWLKHKGDVATTTPPEVK